jgi:hypothetical protein
MQDFEMAMKILKMTNTVDNQQPFEHLMIETFQELISADH